MKVNRAQTDEMTRAITSALRLADNSRRQGIQIASNILAAKLRAMQRESAPPDSESAAVAARAKAAYFQNLSKAVEAIRLQDAHLPAPAPDSFVIHGRVTDPQGQPLANHLLKLADPKQSIADRIPPTPSDEQGFITLTLRAAEFPDLVKNKTDLFLTVTDPSGREVYAPEEALHLEAGKAAVFSAVSQVAESGAVR